MFAKEAADPFRVIEPFGIASVGQPASPINRVGLLEAVSAEDGVSVLVYE